MRSRVAPAAILAACWCLVPRLPAAEEAVREYGAGGAIDPSLAWPSACIAEVRAEQGRLPEAEAGFREALDLLSKGGDGPSEGWVRSSLAVVLWRQGRPAEAIGALRRAAEPHAPR